MFNNKKEIENKLKFMKEFVEIVNLYVDCCDDYFQLEQNKKEHAVLYNYYKNFSDNIINCAKRHGVV